MEDIEKLLSKMAHDVNKKLALELVFTNEIEDTETWKKFTKLCTLATPKDQWVRVYEINKYEEILDDPYHWDPGMTLLDKWGYVNSMRNTLVMVKHYKNLARKELEKLGKNGGK